MPKRGENIRKRKDGRWEARILTEFGNYKSVYAQSYSELKIKLKDYEKSKSQQRNFKYTKITFEQLCIEWIKEKEIQNKQSTVSIYRGIIKRHLLPSFKHIQLSQISKEEINKFIRYKSYQEHLSPKTVKDITAVLIQILKYAEQRKYINAVTYDIARPQEIKKELEVLTPYEQTILVSKIKENITYENIGILLSLYAGLRIGEVCALQWQDIDFENQIISITKTMQRITVQGEEHKTKVIIDTPKSQKSQRKIPIPDFLFYELKKLYWHCADESYILTGTKNRFIEPRTYQYKFKKILSNAGLRNINYHALRHTFATRAIEQNIDIKTISELLGHATVNFTLERYVHPSIMLKKQSMEKLAVCY